MLVTHSLRFLSDVDYIVIMSEGTIAEAGTFSDLLRDSPTFANFLKNYTGLADEEDETELSEEGIFRCTN